MRVFVTGATGYIGGAVAGALRKHGHEVTALVRPESDDGSLRADGIFIVSGDLGSIPGLRDTIAKHDAIVHTAFSSKDPVESDRKAVEVFASLDAFFLFTSGVWVLGSGKSDEDKKVNPIPMVAWRPAHEQKALANGHGAVVRPGCVYGANQSLLAAWFAAAEQKKPISIVGDGKNRWAMVNLHDLADCYVRIVEQRATGIFHGVDDSRDSLNDVAKAIAPSGTIEHVPADAARQKMGPFVDALILDQDVSSVKTRQVLGWKPSRTFVNSVDEQWREWRTGVSS